MGVLVIRESCLDTLVMRLRTACLSPTPWPLDWARSSHVRKNGDLWWLRPDGKTQVTIEYKQKADGSVEPQKIHTVVISTQHAEPLKAVRSKECSHEGYSGPEMTAPSMEEM